MTFDPLQDYPSIYQLNQLLAQENIIPIFAVDTEIVNEYQVRSHRVGRAWERG